MAEEPKTQHIGRRVIGALRCLGTCEHPGLGVRRNLSSSRRAPSGEAMTRRKVEISRADLKRKWPHNMALPAEKVRASPPVK
jgi:hypothetical protein